jgi:hypothetical protein
MVPFKKLSGNCMAMAILIQNLKFQMYLVFGC